MGVYSSNRGYLGMNYNSDEIVANENYVGAIGAAQILIENTENDRAIFEAVLRQDFEEAAGLKDGTLLESELSIVTEASFGGFIDKIKEFLKKAWEKIKGMFKSFMTKVSTIFVRDNKAFVDKYKAEVLKKDLSKMKYKWSKPKAAYYDIASTTVDGFKVALNKTSWTEFSGLDVDGVSKFVESNYEDNKLLESILGGAVGGNTSVGEFAKDFHSYCFEDQDETEGLKTDELNTIMNELVNGKKTLETLTKCQTAADKYYSDALKEVDKARNAIVKDIPNDAQKGAAVDVDGKKIAVTNGNRTVVNARLNAMYTGITICQSAVTRITSANITELKFGLAQDRRVFAQAASFNPKAVKENALLVEAAGDVAEYETDELFASYEA